MYQEMVTIRRLELASDALYKAKKIRGLYAPLIECILICSWYGVPVLFH